MQVKATGVVGVFISVSGTATLRSLSFDIHTAAPVMHGVDRQLGEA